MPPRKSKDTSSSDSVSSKEPSQPSKTKGLGHWSNTYEVADGSTPLFHLVAWMTILNKDGSYNYDRFKGKKSNTRNGGKKPVHWVRQCQEYLIGAGVSDQRDIKSISAKKLQTSFGNQSDQFMSQEQDAEPAEDDAPADIPVDGTKRWPSPINPIHLTKKQILCGLCVSRHYKDGSCPFRTYVTGFHRLVGGLLYMQVRPGVFHKVVVEKEEIPEVAWLRYEYRGSGKNEDKNQWFRRPEVHYEWALSVKAWTLHHETKEKRDEMYQFCRMQGFKVITHETEYIIDAASGNLEETKRKRQRY
ncbi:hypothetical protein B9479_007244 [Cryptococcus floricola]|uniref:Uncharacterized protein n=1 Tax=Cryptococcus floricola TaxID=2591691 RepID=A0A5D3AKU3_9TREE|nr:hypothetical protein B9479_007244 [Cryptococcus floricola]